MFVQSMASAAPFSHAPAGAMRVVMLSTLHERCGIATYTEMLVPALESSGVTVSVISPKRQKADPGWGEQPVRLWRRNRAFGFEALETMREIETRKPDLVHLQVNRSLYSSRFLFDLAWLCRRRRIPLVATLHGRKIGSWGEDFKLWRLLAALRRADLVVHTVSHAAEIGRDRVHVIPHGIDVGPRRGQAEARRALGIAEDAVVITHFGFLVPDKGVDQVLTAVADLRRTAYPDLLYRVAGAVYSTSESRRCFESLTAQLRALGLESAVTMTGDFLSDDALGLELEAATLIVLNYRTGNSQGASGAVRRALSSGRPVAVSGAAVFDDVRGAVHTLAGPLDAAISSTLGSPALLEQTAARAKAFCEADAWPCVARRHAALYAEITGRRGER
jgi:glycosyltransferase involved in cell wall biosynthesis